MKGNRMQWCDGSGCVDEMVSSWGCGVGREGVGGVERIRGEDTAGGEWDGGWGGHFIPSRGPPHHPPSLRAMKRLLCSAEGWGVWVFPLTWGECEGGREAMKAVCVSEGCRLPLRRKGNAEGRGRE